jgi:hypothetical protein
MARALSGRVHSGQDGRLFWLDAHPFDGAVVATACEDGCVGLWRDVAARAQRRRRTFAAHSEEVLRLCWDTAGAHEVLYTGGADGAVHAWRALLEDGGEPRRLASASPAVRAGGDDEGQIYALLQPRGAALGDLVCVAHDNAVRVLCKEGGLSELLAWRYHPLGTASVGGERNPLGRAFVFDAYSSAEADTLGGAAVLVALSDGTLRARDLRAPLRDLAAVVAHTQSYATCVTARGALVAVGSGAGALALLDARTWKPLTHVSPTTPSGAPLFGCTFWPSAVDIGAIEGEGEGGGGGGGAPDHAPAPAPAPV